MSIKVNYRGKIGNCLFQYVYARLLAEHNGFHLSTPFPYQKLLQTTPTKPGEIYNSPKILLEEPIIPNSDISGRSYDMNKAVARLNFYQNLRNRLMPGQYLLTGYFEYPELFNPHERLIKSYFLLDEFEKNTEDIVINLRFGDFADLGRIISSEWYLKILDREKFNKLYIVGGAANEPYLEAFKKYDPIIVASDPWNDFHFIRSFDKIICSNSTYCWWAAFFSEASTIYISDKWISPLLTSCKHSILIEADYLKSFSSSFRYSGVTGLIPSNESLKLKLDSFIVPNNEQIRDFVIKCLEIIYYSVKSTKISEHYVLQLNVCQIGKFSLTFYDGRGWLSSGSALLADCQIYFADWKSFHDWIFCELKDIRNVSPYFKMKGNLGTLVSGFNFCTFEDELNNIFNNFSTEAPFLDYKGLDDVTEEVTKIINQGALVAWFVIEIETWGKLYILYEADHSHEKYNFLTQECTEFFTINEIYLNNSLEDLVNQQNINCINTDIDLKRILHETVDTSRKKLFEVNFKKQRHSQISMDDALRLFYYIDATHLKIDNYIVSKNYNYSG